MSLHRLILTAFTAVFLLSAGREASANTPPVTPTWIEPDSADVVSAFDPHWNTDDFADPDGDLHLMSDFEVYDDSLSVRVWSALGTNVLTHIHLGDGVLEGPLAGESRFDFDRPYRVRARFRDDSGMPNDWSAWSDWVPFRTAPQFVPFPMLVADVDSMPPYPQWLLESTAGVELSSHFEFPAFLVFLVEGQEVFRLFGSNMGNQSVNQPPLPEHGPLKLMLGGGNNGINKATSRLEFVDEDDRLREIYFPPLAVAPYDTAYLWVDDGGNTYWGTEEQTEPDFSIVAQQIWVPWEVTSASYEVDRVAANLHLPVNLVFVDPPGLDSLDVLFYVTELYGKVKAVTNSGVVYTFADSVLNFDPTGVFPGSGEMGVTGLCREPVTGDLFVSAVYDSLGSFYNRVLRLEASPDGLSEVGRTVIVDGIPSFASHQIQEVTIGPDSLLYVQVGEAFAGGAVSQDPMDHRGKVLRMNLDGTSPGDNPYGPTSLVYCVGLRNPFGGAWRDFDQTLYATDNGTNQGDRVVKIQPGWNYGFCCDFSAGAIKVFDQRVGPTALDFDNQGLFGGEDLYVAWSGATYALAQAGNGKQIYRMALSDTGAVAWEAQFMYYKGLGYGTVVGLEFGPDGLYFTDLYGEDGFDGNGITNANVYRIRLLGPTGIDPETPSIPDPPRMILGAPFPNPSSGATTVRFSLETGTRVEARVLDVRGRSIRRLVSEPFGAGEHRLQWDGLDDSGRRAAAGVYWIRLATGDRHEAVRLVLIR